MGTGTDPRMREALRLVQSGEKEQARQLLIEILKHDRDNFDARAVMAQLTDDRQEAIRSIKQALRLRPDDERAQRYLEYLLADQAGEAPVKMLKTAQWLLVGLVTVAIIGLVTASILLLPRLALASQSAALSDDQPETIDCAALIKRALEVSDQGCDQVGRDQVCYGHNTLQARLAPSANTPFDRPGNIIPINMLESITASPLDLQKGDWGVGIFRLEANLPGTLPGQLVTLLVFGNTSIRNISGNMQIFYFMSGLGGIRCDTVPFDGILVRIAEGAGFVFKANGVDITLRGNSIIQAFAGKHLTVTALNGTDTVSAFGREQSIDAGQAVTVPLGGPNGLEPDGPPDPPQNADGTVINANCALTSAGCPPTSSPPENTTVPGASTATSGPTNVTLAPTDRPTPAAQPSLTQTTPATLTQTPQPPNTPTPTKAPPPTKVPPRTKAPRPTKAPPPTHAPIPTKAPRPTKAPPPTHAPTPTH